jgi:mono/diheme cytochrome c family protein
MVLARISSGRISLVAAVLLVGAQGGAQGAASAGQTIYDRDCAECHGATGKGDGETAAYLTPKPQDLTMGILKKQTDPFLTSVIAKGGKANGLSDSMPAFPKLSKTDLQNVVTYIRQLAKGAPPQPAK